MPSGWLCVAPVERRAVDPDAVKDDGDLAGNGDLRLLHTYPLQHPAERLAAWRCMFGKHDGNRA